MKRKHYLNQLINRKIPGEEKAIIEINTNTIITPFETLNQNLKELRNILIQL